MHACTRKIYLQTHCPLVTKGYHSLCPELCLQVLVLPMGHCLRDVSTQSCTLILPVGTRKIMYLPMDSTEVADTCSPVDVSFPSDTALCNKECRLNLLCPNCILLPFSEGPLPLNPSPFPTKGSSLSIARCSRFDIVHKDDDSFGNVEDVFHSSLFKDLLLSRQMWSDKEISVPWLLMVYAVSLSIVLTSASSFLLAASALLNQTSLAPCLQPQL